MLREHSVKIMILAVKAAPGLSSSRTHSLINKIFSCESSHQFWVLVTDLLRHSLIKYDFSGESRSGLHTDLSNHALKSYPKNANSHLTKCTFEGPVVVAAYM